METFEVGLDALNIMKWLQGYGDWGMEHGGLNETSPWAHIFEYLVPSWWNNLGKIRSCGFVGEVMEGFEVSTTAPGLVSACCLWMREDVRLPATTQCPVYLLPAMIVTD